jgi:23S rRNA G2069 N7-methylase RlmK/C1962 C5-methylase RlmI
LKERGITSEITFFDASENALKLAKKNAESVGAKVKTIKGDILEDMKNIPDRSFDLVISDPPALISGRKD